MDSSADVGRTSGLVVKARKTNHNLINSEIDLEIQNAFGPMEAEVEEEHAVVDLEVEWDPYFTVDTFDALNNPHAFYKIDKVRVRNVWMDEKSNKLYIIMHDKNGLKMAAQVPHDLLDVYENRELAQTFVSIHHFKIGYVDPTQYPRFENYSFARHDWIILVDAKTVITKILSPDLKEFSVNGWIPSIRALLGDKTPRKMLIDTVGRVIKGDIKQYFGYKTCELWLRDLTGADIKFLAYYTLHKVPARLSRVIVEKGTIFITRVKLVKNNTGNFLKDTEVSTVEFDPDMKETQALKKMKI